MKRQSLLRHPRWYGCYLKREGAANKANQRISINSRSPLIFSFGEKTRNFGEKLSVKNDRIITGLSLAFEGGSSYGSYGYSAEDR